MHTAGHANLQLEPTIGDVVRYRERIFGWLQEIAEHDEPLSEKMLEEVCDLFDRLNDSILCDNCDPFGKLETLELKPDAIKLFETFCAWGEITFSAQSRKYRRNLN
ncbi:MAG: hypothetical protein Q8R36_05490 [bacterium]|nr:hypothetical protein [bacterium]